MASALVFELSKVEHPHIREGVVGHLRHIDEGLAQRVATGLGMPALAGQAADHRAGRRTCRRRLPCRSSAR